jgi:hypothetical protein
VPTDNADCGIPPLPGINFGVEEPLASRAAAIMPPKIATLGWRAVVAILSYI